ncbi:uncharacterized protein LOC123264914 isoform X1 [Cotesia glomerata]|uniref:Uncharacterized protein n=1 Tax=Cotesia glomerata TaxID=32391 RepID=A0AAV7IWR6_COTGL|nr:uncharacterized protein LOC123264914 isoform X1 [Cotesia glomerata]KAH0561167.1 hypothetical protein KQX54_013935 [Cotesia glomerata]
MFRLISICIFSILVNLVIAKIPPSFSLWKEPAKNAVYLRSLGLPPVPGMDTINIPYVPKPLFFPKFVDPKVMIAQKTELLKNLFGGLGPVNYPITDPSDDSLTFEKTKPFLYATSNEIEPSEDIGKLENILKNDKKETDNVKRGTFGSKFGLFGPVNSKFFPSSPKFPSGLSYSYPETKFNDFDSTNSLARRKRSIMSPMTNVPTDQGSFSPYPEVDPIFQYPEYYNFSAPQPYFPSVLGPVGSYPGYGPFYATPMIDPASMFTAKKTAFLNQFFKSLGPSASNPETDMPYNNPESFWSPSINAEVTTEIPVPKSTIVPPGFWAPSSIVPAPGEYTTKVSFFLDKLFKSITNKTAAKAASSSKISPSIMARSINDLLNDPSNRIARSIDDVQTLSITKDAIVDSIIAELGSLKTDMLNNFDDFTIAQQLSMASMGKNSAKPFKTGFSGLYKSTSTDFSLPYKQKMMVLSKVFDSLTELHKNISSAVSDAIKSNMDEESDKSDKYFEQKSMLNETSADTVQNKAMKMNSPMTYQDPALFYQAFSPSYQQQFPFYQPPTPVQPTEPFWMAFVKAKSTTPKPKKMKGTKREVESDFENYYPSEDYDNEDENKREKYKRAVKMFMRQGLPPGTIENIQAGGGSESGHQGGGMNLFNRHNYEDNYPYRKKWSDWTDNYHSSYRDHQHKHHH